MIGRNTQKGCRPSFSFRLLNSEIGNDQDVDLRYTQSGLGFRLLNSEIGNDLAIGGIKK